MVAESGVVGVGGCRKLNDVPENHSLDSKFVLIFEIWLFKVADFVFLF